MSPDAATAAAEVSAEMEISLATVCRVAQAPRSTIYRRRSRSALQQRLPVRRPRDTCAADPTGGLLPLGPPQNEMSTRAGQLHLTVAPLTMTIVCGRALVSQ
jgi:hypothetical protein